MSGIAGRGRHNRPCSRLWPSLPSDRGRRRKSGQPLDQFACGGLRRRVRAACVPVFHGAALISRGLAGALVALVEDAGSAGCVWVHRVPPLGELKR